MSYSACPGCGNNTHNLEIFKCHKCIKFFCIHCHETSLGNLIRFTPTCPVCDSNDRVNVYARVVNTLDRALEIEKEKEQSQARAFQTAQENSARQAKQEAIRKDLANQKPLTLSQFLMGVISAPLSFAAEGNFVMALISFGLFLLVVWVLYYLAIFTLPFVYILSPIILLIVSFYKTQYRKWVTISAWVVLFYCIYSFRQDWYNFEVLQYIPSLPIIYIPALILNGVACVGASVKLYRDSQLIITDEK